MRFASASPRRPTRLASWLLLSLWLAAPTAAEERGLGTLMEHFARSRGVEAAFREEKTLPLLQQPLVSEGRLYYAPPGRMARFTTAPERSSLLVDASRVRMEDGLGVEEIDLSAHAEARRFVAQLLLLFEGDQQALEREYRVRFTSDAAEGSWALQLEPRGFAVRQVIREITLRGREAWLDEMVVSGTRGETTRTTYAHMQTDRPFSDAELAQLFPDDGAPEPLPPREVAPTP
ncbi:MAG: outer membrane lipoprotein carrier protein LolA [Myxococcota bacterium]